jgi:alanine racemase
LDPAVKDEASGWRGRACWAEVDLDAIEANCRAMRAILRPGADLMAVVKANAYGHGLAGVAPAMLAGGASSFGVACVEEGIELRSIGIDAPVLVLGYVPAEEAERVVRLDLAVTVTTPRLAHALAQAATRAGRSVTVHVKVDTGMGRFGLAPEETLAFVESLRSLPGLRVEGLFTHLATAEEEDQRHARRQIACFRAVRQGLAAHDLLPPVVHLANSAGAIAFPEEHHDLVRSGICLFGVCPGAMPGIPRLLPALTLRARVARVRRLPAGSCVGYGCTFRAARDADVALIPIGYADGWSRSLSNRGAVLVNGRRAPLVGRVSMDQCSIDVTDAGPVAQDDEVVLIGQQGEESLDAAVIATWRGTIAYEVLAGLAPRVPRLYRRSGEPVAVSENGQFQRLAP